MKLIEDLPERMEKVKEMFLKYLEELKSTQTEMNNILEGINSRITEQEKSAPACGREEKASFGSYIYMFISPWACPM